MTLLSPVLPGRISAKTMSTAPASEIPRSVASNEYLGIGALLLGWRSAWTRRAHLRRDQEIGRFIEAHGGIMTDELERTISRRFGQFRG